MITSELRLAIACCRHGYSADAAEDVHRWSAHVDWNAFLHLIRRHRVASLAAQAFYRTAIAPPPSFAWEIGADSAAIAERNLRSASESGRLLEAFGGASLPLIFVKGLSLSAVAYGDPFLKMSSDVDILVELDRVEASAQVLRGLGYSPVVPGDRPSLDLSAWHARHKESAWRNPNEDVVVELHTRLADNPAMIPGIGLASARQEVPAGPGLSLSTLNSRDLFAYLCVHGASSAWFRLKWIADLAGLVSASGEDVALLYGHAVAQGAGRAPAQALLLAERLSLVELSPDLKSDLAYDRASRILAAIAFSQLSQRREPTARMLGTASIHASQALLLPGSSFMSGEIARQAGDFFRRNG